MALKMLVVCSLCCVKILRNVTFINRFYNSVTSSQEHNMQTLLADSYISANPDFVSVSSGKLIEINDDRGTLGEYLESVHNVQMVSFHLILNF